MVDQGTTVVWDWSGRGGHHDVSHLDGEFLSEMTDETGFSFEHTFDSPGTYKYSCRPHEAVGMKGAVIVQE